MRAEIIDAEFRGDDTVDHVIDAPADRDFSTVLSTARGLRNQMQAADERVSPWLESAVSERNFRPSAITQIAKMFIFKDWWRERRRDCAFNRHPLFQPIGERCVESRRASVVHGR